MSKTRRGRSRLPRGYYLVSSAKRGGFEVADYVSMPVVSNPAIAAMVGQAEEEAAAMKAEQEATRMNFGKLFLIALGITGAYFGAKKIGLIGG